MKVDKFFISFWISVIFSTAGSFGFSGSYYFSPSLVLASASAT
jgi:hypothetical protein